jgi:hypothetical protein
MKKKHLKQFRQMAAVLPPVAEWARSGANLYAVEINHERRLRHAYEKLGEEGVMAYLDSIKRAQEARKNSGIDNKIPDDESTPRTEGAE